MTNKGIRLHILPWYLRLFSLLAHFTLDVVTPSYQRLTCMLARHADVSLMKLRKKYSILGNTDLSYVHVDH